MRSVIWKQQQHYLPFAEKILTSQFNIQRESENIKLKYSFQDRIYYSQAIEFNLNKFNLIKELWFTGLEGDSGTPI